MDEIIPGLWIGDISSAMNAEHLKQSKVQSVVSVMRGKLSVPETFYRHQISIDDEQSADILQHLVPAISFIQKELDKGRGVLVHCQAGISRSTTIVAAYLMYTEGLDTQGALSLIRQARPIADPNEGFLSQLELFRQASFQVSRHDKVVRMFYLDRVMRDVMNHGGPVETDMFARHPDDPIPSKPSPKRKIRCKMCRQELATREHMLDHGQLGPSSPFPVSPNVPPPQNSTNTPGMSSHAAYPQNPSETSKSRDGNPHVPVVSESPTAVQAQASLDSTEVVLGTSPVILPDNSGAINSLPIQGTKPLILSDPKCSGYFVEPMKWMETFLSQGQMSGKILCPNKRCKAKLGNYDWAGVHCSCKEWVVPGFCVHRSKVDEIE